MVGGGDRLDRYLAEAAGMGLSRSAAHRLIRSGQVTVNGHPGRSADRVSEGDELEVQMPAPAPSRILAEPIPLRVVYQDPDLVVIDKPAGMVVHPAPGHAGGTLVNALLGLGGGWSWAAGEERPGLVHRLDKGTSGLILAARTEAAHRALAAQLADRTLSRTYLAIARGEVPGPGGELEGDIARNPRHRQRMAVVAGGRFARTRYQVLERLPGHTLLRCELDTGRTHQIRVHLATFGHPLVGDRQYGRARPGEPDRPMLHAWKLRLRHPRTGEEMVLETPPPADFEACLAALR